MKDKIAKFINVVKCDGQFGTIKKTYPYIKIVGTCSGYEKGNIAINKINNSKADILFVGLGNLKQEQQFILNNMESFENVKIFMPVGGSFNVISGVLKRAPIWMIF